MLVVTVCLLASIVVGIRNYRQLIESIERLTTALRRIANNPDDAPFVREEGELEQLSAAMNRMFQVVSSRQDRLHQTADRLTTVLGAMVEGVLAVDDRQRVLFANHAAGELLGFVPEDAQGRALLEVARNHMLHEAVTEALAHRDQPDQETRQYEFDSHQTHGQILSFRATRLQGDPCPGVVLVLQDITELRRLEHLRQEFVANVSHELKTPLASIQAYAETLAEGAIDRPDVGRQFLGNIQREADRLNALIVDMLKLARIESGHAPFDIESVALREAITESVRRQEHVASHKNIEIHVDGPSVPLYVAADVEGLRTILDNLLDNAIKYTEEGGRVTVQWESQASVVEICVADNGVGIPREHQARVFERFFRVDQSRSRELGSTGLGLAIVKHIAQAFGGTIRVESEPQRGSKFYVTLPTSQSQPTDPAAVGQG